MGRCRKAHPAKPYETRCCRRSPPARRTRPYGNLGPVRLEASPSLVDGAALLMRLGPQSPSRVRIPEPPLYLPNQIFWLQLPDSGGGRMLRQVREQRFCGLLLDPVARVELAECVRSAHVAGGELGRLSPKEWVA